MPEDGSEIKNSKLYGDVFFDVQRPTTATFYFTNNNPLTKLELNSDNAVVQNVVLENNTFADLSGARVIIKTNFTVEAEGNVTTKGPCECDALEDFNTSGSNLGEEALDLISWVYDGIEYDKVDLTIVGDIQVSYNLQTCIATVAWNTSNPSASTVYHGQNCSSLNDSDSDETLTKSHSIEVDISGYSRNWSFKVFSANACDSVYSDCISKKRPTCMQ